MLLAAHILHKIGFVPRSATVLVDKFSAFSSEKSLPDVLFPLKSSIHAQKSVPPSSSLLINWAGLWGTERGGHTLSRRVRFSGR